MALEVCILGVGKSGVAAARHALAHGEHVTIYAGMGTEATHAAAAEFEQAGVPVFFDTEDVKGRYDLCVVCPGIPQTSAFYKSAQAASDMLMSEPEYAWRVSSENWVAITGTNGKTTTTSLVTHILNECGMVASACGNIGDTAMEAVENRRDGEVLVAEMSSFQIASTKRFCPQVAVLLNITPDHLSWHGGFGEYSRAKYKLFDQMGPGQTAVIADGVPDARSFVADLRQRGLRVVTVGERRQQDCAYLDGQRQLCVRHGQGEPTVLLQADDLQIKGSHNVENALAAAVVALELGCDAAQVAAALKSFAPLEHRIEPCGTVGGVEFFNDSKGTNVDATLKALTAFPQRKVVLMLGGRDKGTDLTELVAACQGVCSAIVAYGEGGPRFYEAFADAHVRRGAAPDLRTAFDLACSMAQPGEAVLLSPACASFDEFKSFEERGRTFKGYVAQLAEKEA